MATRGNDVVAYLDIFLDRHTFRSFQEVSNVPLVVAAHVMAVVHDQNCHAFGIFQIREKLRRQKEVLCRLVFDRGRHQHVENFPKK